MLSKGERTILCNPAKIEPGGIMHNQDAGTWNSGRSGSHRQNHTAIPAVNTFTVKFLFAILLAAICPGMLLASEQTNSTAASKLPQAPQVTHAAAATTVNLTTVSLSTLFFDFGDNLVGNQLTQTAVVVKNTGGALLHLAAPTLKGDASFKIVQA